MTAIHRFQVINRCGPTLEELGAALGISKPTVYQHVEGLRRAGLVGPRTGRSRSVVLSLSTATGRALAETCPLCGHPRSHPSSARETSGGGGPCPEAVIYPEPADLPGGGA